MKNDSWEKAEILSKILAALALPLLLWWLTTSYSNHQKEIEDKRIAAESSANRLTTLLKSLSSENVRERQIAVKTAEYFAKRDLLPADLIPVLLELSINDPNKSVSSDAINSLAAVGQANKSLQPEIQQALAGLPDRVYIHIREESQREDAKKISQLLVENGFTVPGIERLSVGPTNTEVRYFFPLKQANAARKIAELVNKQTGIFVKPILFKGFENKTNPKQYELWIVPKQIP